MIDSGEASGTRRLNPFEKELGIPLPRCCSHGDCCKAASPSKPYYQLWARAAAGDEFARGFLSIMVPYASHEEAEKVAPGVVQRTLKAAKKQPDVFQSESDLVFYRCRYQTEDNRCGVWEDRPQFCRDYPDTPFVVIAPGCAFEPWAAACTEKYQAMKAEVSRLKALKEELAALREAGEGGGRETSEGSQPVAFSGNAAEGFLPGSPGNVELTGNLTLVLSLTDLYLASPFRTMRFGAWWPPQR